MQKILAPLEGVFELSPNYLARMLRVEFDPRRIDAERIAAEIRRGGFTADVCLGPQATSLGRDRPPDAAALGAAARRLATASGAVLLGAAFVAKLALADLGWLATALAIAAAVAAAAPVVQAAWRALRLRSLDMNVLMTVAAIGAIATGDYFEAGAAMTLFGVALWLEGYSLDRAWRAVRTLAEYEPEGAHRFVAKKPAEPLAGEPAAANGAVEYVPIAALRVGDRLLVKPGERFPVDGVVLVGHSSVNQAPMTGESLPVDKQPGDEVFAGTLNGEGAVELRAARVGQETQLAQIARLIEDARHSRARTERFVDAFARRYTPAVVLLAVLLAAAPPMLASAGVSWAAAHPAAEWLHRGLMLLVIACPCALVISTPLTIVCGLQRAASEGLLVKGGEHLENAARITAVVFDKTGTLTAGDVHAVEIVAANGFSADEVLQAVAAIETQSEHPLAQAVVRAARERGLAFAPATDVQARRGLGVQACYRGVPWRAGGVRMFDDLPADARVADQSWWRDLQARAKGATLVVAGTDRRAAGAIVLADRIRDEAPAAVAELRGLGVKHIAILSGDAAAAVADVAARVGADEAHAELTPADKVAHVRRLAAQGCVAMVGDGVNDAPALAAATLGIALGTRASATALETADVVVVAPLLTRVPRLIALSRTVRATLWQNVTLALGIKALVLALAVAGPESLARLWLAVAADVGASLIVVLNGMRLLRGGTTK